jgi:acyl-CoA thioesterase FadM
MEEAEHAFWRAMGVSVVTEVDGREISWPRIKTSCRYYAPARFEDELELALRVTKVGGRSVSFEVDFRCEDRRIAVGHMTVVFCTIGAGAFQPVSIPDRLRQILLGHVIPADERA